MADTRAKALTYLREGRVTVLTALEEGMGERRPYFVAASVDGHQAAYTVTYERKGRGFLDAVWTCSCPSSEKCAHIAAVQLVTGHPSAARREVAT